MLFQPTNITPSLLGDLGNGTVDITDPLVVNWQVNGNTPMTAYRISFYENDADSTFIYQTVIKADGCPFYGVDYKGDIQFFSHTISEEILYDQGFQNGHEYKMVITEWWCPVEISEEGVVTPSDNTQKVVQSSASVFNTRAKPVLTIDDIPNPLQVRDYEFTAQYTQAQGDAINWIRWRISESGDEGNPIYDSRNIYGTSELRCYYDGFFSGTGYHIQCDIETENGIQVSTSRYFPVSYSLKSLPAVARACINGNKSGAVKVNWGGFRYITAKEIGPNKIENGILYLPEGSALIWDEINKQEMVIETPWNVLYKGILPKNNCALFEMRTRDAVFMLLYNYAGRSLELHRSPTGGTAEILAELSPVRFEDEVMILMTPDALYVRRIELTGGLYPSDNLYPSASLVPQRDYIPVVMKDTMELDYTQTDVTAIAMSGEQTCDYLQLIVGDVEEIPFGDTGITIKEAMHDEGTYTPINAAGTFFLADFINGTNAGSLYIEGTGIEGWAVYRKREDQPNMVHLIDLPLKAYEFLDYGCKSQQGPYTYYIYPMGDRVYITDAIISNPIKPVFWNWSIIECEQEEDKLYHTFLREYVFRYDVSSGTVSNNNNPSVSQNFTRYPYVAMSHVNYQSGTIEGLIGDVHIADDGRLVYEDTTKLRDEIWGLSYSRKELYLKNRKGDLFPIRFSGEVEFDTEDNTREQMLRVSIPWVQIYPDDEAGIIHYVEPIES